MSKLIYKSAGDWDWDKALPIGNGKLGAMIYAPAGMEHYQLNEDSVWFGGARDRNNKDALLNLEKVRKLIFDGKIPQAEELLKYAFSGTPQSQHPYQTLGDIYFDFCGKLSNPVEYQRELCLDEAIHKVTSTEESTGIVFTREAFASAGTNCIVTRFEASQKGMLDLAASLQRLCFYEKTEHTEDAIYITGNLGGNGMDFCCGVKMISEDGDIQGLGEHVIAKGATRVTVYITALTQFRSDNPRLDTETLLEAAAARSYEEIKNAHMEEYQGYFNRMRLCLDYDRSLDEKMTDERLARISEAVTDNGLINTYFDYGRYLLISSSRGDCLPANLQGIWNKDLNPAWGSKYTININTEMNYWPAGICNLSECQEPLFEHLLRMESNGIETARKMYGCDGFVAHHNTDIWGDTAPQDIYIPATYWVMGGAWLCTHIWDHYEFTKDKKILEKMYCMLKESVQFFFDFLIEKDGEYLTCPSVSPENTYVMEDGTRGCISAGCTMDNEILHELFEDFLMAAEEVLEEDVAFIEKAKHYKAHLPQIQIGKHGQIMEWKEDYDELEPGHRHISHLWALHPSFQITPDLTKELCEAAKITLTRRLQSGGGHTGWSRAWIMNMYARLWDGEKAYDNLVQLLKKSTLPNLLDNHPPFQIDGNFGAISAIGEMLLQSGKGRTILLPALPRAWKNGKVERICARGGAEYSFVWKESVLQSVIIFARADEYKTTVIYSGKEISVSLCKGETVTIKNWGNENEKIT